MGRKKYLSVQEANLESGCSGFDPVTLIASNRVGNINYKRGSGDRPCFLNSGSFCADKRVMQQKIKLSGI